MGRKRRKGEGKRVSTNKYEGMGPGRKERRRKRQRGDAGSDSGHDQPTESTEPLELSGAADTGDTPPESTPASAPTEVATPKPATIVVTSKPKIVVPERPRVEVPHPSGTAGLNLRDGDDRLW